MLHVGIRVGTLAAIISAGLLMAAAQAADSRLDDANAHLIKAKALVEAARSSNPAQDYQKHINRAEDLLAQAMHEIDLAKTVPSPPVPRIRTPQTGKSGGPANPSALIQLNPQPEPPAPK